MDIKIRKGTRIISLQATEKRALAAPLEVLDALIDLSDQELWAEAVAARAALAKLVHRFPVKKAVPSPEAEKALADAAQEFLDGMGETVDDDACLPCAKCSEPVILLEAGKGRPCIECEPSSVQPGDTHFNLDKGHVKHVCGVKEGQA